MRPPDWQTEDGSIRLYHGDCLDILPELEAGSVDAVVTDPPYGRSHSSNRQGEFRGNVIHGDWSTEIRDAALCQLDHLPMAVFGQWQVEKFGSPHTMLVWSKGPASGMGDLSIPWKPSWEDIAIYGRGWIGRRTEAVLIGHYVVTWSGNGQRVHPNEKPVSLIECEIVAKSPAWWVILDPFMGSGTTGVACVRLGRTFIGIEKERKYFDIAVKRITDELGKLRLFEPLPKIVQRNLLEEETS